MESLGVALGASWSSLDAAMSVEESELMAQLLAPYPFPTENDQNLGVSSIFLSEYSVDPYYSTLVVDPSLCHCSQENCGYSSSFIAPHTDYKNYYQSESSLVLAIDAASMQMNFCMTEEHTSDPSLQVVPSNVPRDQICMFEEVTSGKNSGNSNTSIQGLDMANSRSQPKRKLYVEENDKQADIPPEGPKKKARASSNVRIVKNEQPRKAQKSGKTSDEDESNAAVPLAQSPICYSSENDSNASQELNGEGTSSCSKGSTALTPSGKSRAGRGSATDPQSLYARKRRERINEKLRILQALVPNGTKVDISTMLEEAVQYVKFLQLQIKLLSSDDMWMYAPLAYNGMDIGLDLKISPPK